MGHFIYYDVILNTVINGESLNRKIQEQHSDLLVIDTRPFSDYIAGHIIGSFNLDLMNFHWLDTTKEGLLHFNRQMKILLNYLGIDSMKTVVFYDDISGSTASRGVWLLHYFSHNRVYLLDGGFKDWVKSNYPTEIKTHSFMPIKCDYVVDNTVLADFDYVKDKIEENTNDVVILDCRSEGEYNGLIARAYKKGHIPKAININWINNLENDKFKELDNLDRLYSFIPKDKEIITYCQGGYRAANTYLVLKKLGYVNVKMYLGSWNEWGNIDTTPVE